MSGSDLRKYLTLEKPYGWAQHGLRHVVVVLVLKLSISLLEVYEHMKRIGASPGTHCRIFLSRAPRSLAAVRVCACLPACGRWPGLI